VTSKQLSLSNKMAILALALFVLTVRLCTLPFPDLVDTTEGRYAGVAQIMLERDDWVTPWIHYEGHNQPYLGKPPLHFWLVQTAFLIFGQNSFAARLPGVVSAAGIALALYLGILPILGLEATMVALAVFLSSCMTFFLGGSVLLDVTLTLGISICLLAFLHVERSKIAGYIAFAGAALGVMTKGPLACLLIGCVVAPWAVAHRVLVKRWPSQLAHIPWIRGGILFLALVVPWYIWAELRNPGFLKYFLLNENLGRYLHKDYVDEYGSGHRQPRGAGFLMMLLAVFPWSFVVLNIVAQRAKQVFSKQTITALGSDPVLLYALCWALSCPVLLLGATQYTATYLMPSVPGFAMLAGVLWNRYRDHTELPQRILRQTFMLGTGFVIITWIVISIVALWFIPNLTIILGSLGLAIWSAITFIRFARTTTALNQCLGILSLLALVCTLTYGAATLCFNNNLSTNRSSRRVLQAAQALLPTDSGLRIGFPYYFPFSAWFYHKQILGAEGSVIAIEEGDVKTAPVDVLIVRKRNLERLKQELPEAQEGIAILFS
jgi:4-amino-4-deoxy-L-arabinose transferase-like glycosyltransferase